MRRDSRLAASVLLFTGLSTVTAPLAAQTGTAEQLGRARALYERLEIERALPLLRQLVSPQWPHEVSAEQRVEAYTYLGAALVLAGRTDSGVVYFRAALDRDPFTDLDPERFTPGQLAALARARRETFAAATRPVAQTSVDPRTDRVRFTFVTTHAATARAELRRAEAPAAVVLFDGVTDGVREIAWDGLWSDGRLATPGRYEVRLVAASRLLPRADTARSYFDLRHEVAELEDTLPSLGPGDLRPEHSSGSLAARELAKGVAVAGAVLAVSGLLVNGDLGADRTPAAVVAGAAAAGGLVAYFVRRRSPDIPENITANRRRLEERHLANEAIRARNAERIARTVLLLAPAAGVGP